MFSRNYFHVKVLEFNLAFSHSTSRNFPWNQHNDTYQYVFMLKLSWNHFYWFVGQFHEIFSTSNMYSVLFQFFSLTFYVKTIYKIFPLIWRKIAENTFWESRQKLDQHWFWINIFFVKSTFLLVKKLTNSRFHGNF